MKSYTKQHLLHSSILHSLASAHIQSKTNLLTQLSTKNYQKPITLTQIHTEKIDN